MSADGERTAQRDATGQWDLADATVLTQLEGRGIDVVSGPVVVGEPSRGYLDFAWMDLATVPLALGCGAALLLPMLPCPWLVS